MNKEIGYLYGNIEVMDILMKFLEKMEIRITKEKIGKDVGITEHYQNGAFLDIQKEMLITNEKLIPLYNTENEDRNYGKFYTEVFKIPKNDIKIFKISYRKYDDKDIRKRTLTITKILTD